MSSRSKVYCLVCGCKKTCTNLTILTNHVLNDHCPSKEDTLHCPLCHHVTSTDHNIMTYHIRSQHTGDKPYHCPDCKCTFSLEANLNTHCRVRHQTQSVPTISSHSTSVVSNLKKHSCITCGKKFSSHSQLLHHSHIYCGKKTMIIRIAGKVLPILMV